MMSSRINENQTFSQPLPSYAKKVSVVLLACGIIGAVGMTFFYLNSQNVLFQWKISAAETILAQSVLGLSTTIFTIGGCLGVLLLNRINIKKKNESTEEAKIENLSSNPPSILEQAYTKSTLIWSGENFFSPQLNRIKNNSLDLIDQNPDQYRVIFYNFSVSGRMDDGSAHIECFRKIREKVPFIPTIIVVVSVPNHFCVNENTSVFFMRDLSQAFGENHQIYFLILKKQSLEKGAAYSEGFKQFQEEVLTLAYQNKHQELKELIKRTQPEAFAS